MLASKTSRQSSAVWQGLTKDGYTLRLTRSVLTQITSKLKQTGLERLVHSLRSNNQVNLEGAVIRSIAQVINHATASGIVSSRTFGRNLRAFTAIGKTRQYQILTQPIDSKQSAILFVRSSPIQQLSNEFEYEGRYENEYEGEYEVPPAPPVTPNNIIKSIRNPTGNRIMVSGTKNIAFAIVNIGNQRTRIDANSGQTNQGQPFFKATATGRNPRTSDSEIKILDQVARQYGKQARHVPEREVTGSVYLFTERPPCSSCSNVFRQFRNKFPKIKLIVQHGKTPIWNPSASPRSSQAQRKRLSFKPKRRHSI